MATSERNYSEKRDFLRMQVQTPIVLNVGGETFHGVCLDLSSTGMQVLCAASLKAGDRLQVHIPSVHAELKGLDAQAQVVRVELLDDGRQSLGLALLTID